MSGAAEDARRLKPRTKSAKPGVEPVVVCGTMSPAKATVAIARAQIEMSARQCSLLYASKLASPRLVGPHPAAVVVHGSSPLPNGIIT